MSPPLRRGRDLPPPDGIVGHVRHTWSAVFLLWSWRRHYQRLDDALRDAVQARDRHLEALGRAAAEQPLDPPLSAFVDTLTALGAELAVAVSAHEDQAVALAAAEAERAEALRAHDAVVEAASAELRPHERALAAHQGRIAALDRVGRTREGERANLEARQRHVEHRLTAGDLEPEARARLVEEQRGLEARLDALVAEARAALEARTPLEEELPGLRAAVAARTEVLDAARDARREARQAAEAKVLDLQAQVRERENTVRALEGRRRAVFVDLGAAAVEAEVEVAEHGPAADALQQVEALRAEYAQLDAEWAAFDGAAMRRTLMSLGAVFALLLIVLIAW